MKLSLNKPLPRMTAGAIVALFLASFSIVTAAPRADAAYSRCNYYTPMVWNGQQTHVANIPSIQGSTYCYLNYGSWNNTAVSALQETLAGCYGKNIAIDGQFGNDTLNALKAVQALEGVTADGVYGPQTRSAMSWRIATQMCAPFSQLS